jgi:hypothetical protein
VAQEDDVPIPYIRRTETYYLALGYGNPYRWSHFADVPFTPLPKPLARCRLALITTAAPYRPEAGEAPPGPPPNPAARFFSVYSMPTDRPASLRIDHVAYDRDHASATDVNAYFPLERMKEAAATGRVGDIAPRFHGVPTNRSQRATTERDAPAVITEHCGVPRFLFSDFPLGNPAGKTGDLVSQRRTAELALRVLESAPAARTTVQSPERWSDDPSWKRRYANAEALSADELAELRREFDAQKSVARARRAE